MTHQLTTTKKQFLKKKYYFDNHIYIPYTPHPKKVKPLQNNLLYFSVRATQTITAAQRTE
jgi:hypothetical protein